MDYQIYQIKSEFTRELGFKGLALGCSEIDIEKHYELVYEGNTEESENIMLVLENLFHKFNVNHPWGFTGHSMSVSDVVNINGTHYYCDFMGWIEVENKKGEDVHA